jgi:hypothetical protein
MLDRNRHLILLKTMLSDIYRDNELSAQLVFKGDTCLMLFHGLDRFSTDLDFDLRDGVTDFPASRMTKITSSYLVLDDNDSREKRFGYTWVGSYHAGHRRVKVEVNKRERVTDFDILDFFGISVATMARPQLLAHKICAITDRKTLQNRDLYDADFMLRKLWEPDDEIIFRRTGLPRTDYYRKLIDLLDQPQVKKNILHGLGDVLSAERKLWVRQHLADSLRQQLNFRL